MSITKSLTSGVALAALLSTTIAGARLVGIGDYRAGFAATGPGGLKINGSTSEVTVSERGGKLSIKVQLGGLKTGISLRDKHLKSHLDTAHYPAALLVVSRSNVHVPDDGKSASGDASAALTLHGVTKNLRVHYSAKRTGSDVHVDGNAKVNMKDFGIEPPCYLGVCVKPDVTISTHFKVREQ